MAAVLVCGAFLVPGIRNQKAGQRDMVRMHRLKRLQRAIEAYYLDHGEYPAPESNETYGGWDVSHDGDFLSVLVENGYLDKSLNDPTNDSVFHFRYYVYAPDSYGCACQRPFYVLGARGLELELAPHQVRNLRCADRNWGEELSYVLYGEAPRTEA